MDRQLVGAERSRRSAARPDQRGLLEAGGDGGGDPGRGPVVGRDGAAGRRVEAFAPELRPVLAVDQTHLVRSVPSERRSYYESYAEVARRLGLGFVLESATWRASADWGARLGYSPAELDAANAKAIALLHALREKYQTERSPMVVSGSRPSP